MAALQLASAVAIASFNGILLKLVLSIGSSSRTVICICMHPKGNAV